MGNSLQKAIKDGNLSAVRVAVQVRHASSQPQQGRLGSSTIQILEHYFWRTMARLPKTMYPDRDRDPSHEQARIHMESREYAVQEHPGDINTPEKEGGFCPLHQTAMTGFHTVSSWCSGQWHSHAKGYGAVCLFSSASHRFYSDII